MFDGNRTDREEIERSVELFKEAAYSINYLAYKFQCENNFLADAVLDNVADLLEATLTLADHQEYEIVLDTRNRDLRLKHVIDNATKLHKILDKAKK